MPLQENRTHDWVLKATIRQAGGRPDLHRFRCSVCNVASEREGDGPLEMKVFRYTNCAPFFVMDTDLKSIEEKVYPEEVRGCVHDRFVELTNLRQSEEDF